MPQQLRQQLCQPAVLFVASAVLLCIIAYASFFEQPAAQATEHVLTELEGYAWSDTIGWISMNCSNDGSCGTSDHKVEVHDDLTLQGYGWSDTIGWIKFGGNVANCPGSGSCDARVNTDTNELDGWARACAGTQSGDCSSMTSRTDGWDGWLSLNCTNTGECGTSNYSVSVGSGSLSSYSWGSDVVGWTDWSGVYFTPPCSPSTTCTADNTGVEVTDQWCEVTTTPCTDPEVCLDDTNSCDLPSSPTLVDFDADPWVVRSGETSTITWEVNDASDCTVSGGGDTWTGTSGDEETSLITGQVEYTLECTSLDGSTTTELGSITIVTVATVQEN